MSDHGYEKGRLNLPFVGICTFGKYPYQSDWNNIDADIAILGAPFDCGSQWRSGSRMGPRGIREASTRIHLDTMVLTITRIIKRIWMQIVK